MKAWMKLFFLVCLKILNLFIRSAILAMNKPEPEGTYYRKLKDSS